MRVFITVLILGALTLVAESATIKRKAQGQWRPGKKADDTNLFENQLHDEENSLNNDDSNGNLQDTTSFKLPPGVNFPRPGKKRNGAPLGSSTKSVHRSLTESSSYESSLSATTKRNPQNDWRPGKKDDTGMLDYQLQDEDQNNSYDEENNWKPQDTPLFKVPPGRFQPPRPGKKRGVTAMSNYGMNDASLSGESGVRFPRPGKKRRSLNL